MLNLTHIFTTMLSITCPTASFIHSTTQQIDTIQLIHGQHYAVYSSHSIYDEQSNQKWHVGDDVLANDQQEAYEKAINRILNAPGSMYPNATYLNQHWYCFYSEVYAVN